MLVALGSAAGVVWWASRLTLNREFVLFGSSAELTLRGDNQHQLAAAADQVERLLAAHHRDWHPWQESALTAVNRAIASGEPVLVPPTIARLLAQSRPLVEASSGMFDPGAGGLIALWGFHTSQWPAQGRVPDATTVLRLAATHPSLRDVVVDDSVLRSSNPKVQLDFNAIAEGVAMEDAVRILREHGVGHALLDLGGDIGALGHADGHPWKVALRDPRGGVLGWVELADGEVLFASGNYSKFRDAGGIRRPHIVDPRTGNPVSGIAASVVLDDRPPRADAAATALMVANREQWLALALRMDLVCVAVLTDDDTLRMTHAMQQRLVLLRQPARIEVAVATPRSRCGGRRSQYP